MQYLYINVLKRLIDVAILNGFKKMAVEVDSSAIFYNRMNKKYKVVIQ